MDSVPDRRPTETLDLVALVVTLHRQGVPRVTVLAAKDQAWTSLHHEPHPDVRGTLTWVLRTIESGNHDEVRIDAALRVAARDLHRPPPAGTAR